MLEFILVLSALTMFVSFIAVIRPIKSLRLPTRKRALEALTKLDSRFRGNDMGGRDARVPRIA